MARADLSWRVVHFPLEPEKKKYRAYFEKGGYRDCSDYLEAIAAVSETRGPVVRVERIETYVLWRRKPRPETLEGS